MNTTTHRPYIAIEGVIGVGKTTLARMLRPSFRANLLLEAFDKNPFLSDFYGDRARYAFQTQIFFLLSRYRQQQAILSTRHSIAHLADYLFDKDRLFARLNVKGDELTMYERLYEALAENIPTPDLVVYLRAEFDTLMERIAMRDRPYERRMEQGYIGALRQRYEELFAAYTATPLLVIETDTLNFVRNPADLEQVEQRIRAALAGDHQPPLLQLEAQTTPHINWRLPALLPSEPRSEANWQALGDFLALTTAVGEVGGELARHPPIGPQGTTEELRQSLTQAAHALEALARRTGVSLTEREKE